MTKKIDQSEILTEPNSKVIFYIQLPQDIISIKNMNCLISRWNEWITKVFQELLSTTMQIQLSAQEVPKQ